MTAAVTAPTARFGRWFRWLHPDLVLFASVALLTLIAAVTVGRVFTLISPFDEQAHFDYLLKLVGGDGLPTVGETYWPETFREIACRGVNSDCDTVIGPAEYPASGINYVAMYSPFFYALTAMIAVPLSGTGWFTLFEAARIGTSVWYAVGVGLVAVAAARLGANRSVAFALSVMVAIAPLALLQGATITPDALGPLFAGALLLVATARKPWLSRLLITTAVATLAALNKTNFIPLAAAAVWCAAFAPADDASDAVWRDRTRAERWRWRILGVLLAGVPLAVQGLWNTWRTRVGLPGVPADGLLNTAMETDYGFLTVVAKALSVLVQPINDSGFPPLQEFWAVAMVLQALVLGGALMLALRPHGLDADVRVANVAGLAGFAISVVFLPLTFYVLYHSIGTQARYGIPLLFWFTAIVAAAVTLRRSGPVLAVVAVGLWVATVVATVLNAGLEVPV